MAIPTPEHTPRSDILLPEGLQRTRDYMGTFINPATDKMLEDAFRGYVDKDSGLFMPGYVEFQVKEAPVMGIRGYRGQAANRDGIFLHCVQHGTFADDLMNWANFANEFFANVKGANPDSSVYYLLDLNITDSNKMSPNLLDIAKGGGPALLALDSIVDSGGAWYLIENSSDKSMLGNIISGLYRATRFKGIPYADVKVADSSGRRGIEQLLHTLHSKAGVQSMEPISLIQWANPDKITSSSAS